MEPSFIHRHLNYTMIWRPCQRAVGQFGGGLFRRGAHRPGIRNLNVSDVFFA